MNKIVKMIFGSHLYGTSTESSDKDFKGIFLPTFDDCVLNNIPKTFSFSTGSDKTKNTKDDIDEEIFSLQYFIKLASEGQTVAIDMLHCNDECLIETSDIWKEIVKNRSKFYTKNLEAFVGYARKQAAKYSIKGSRLGSVESILNFCDTIDQSLKLKDVWKSLPDIEHVHFLNVEGIDFYQVCGKKFQSTIKVKQMVDTLSRFYDEYGERAKLAKFNDSVDWKAMSHAIRAALQVKEILTTNDLIFPLKDCRLLLEVKQGKMDFKNEVQPLLEDLMDEVEILSKQSKLPSKVNSKFWREFIINVYKKESCDFI